MSRENVSDIIATENNERKQWDKENMEKDLAVQPNVERSSVTPDQGFSFGLGLEIEHKRKLLQLERQKEYKEFLEQKNYMKQNDKKEMRNSSESQNGFLSKFGAYENDRKKLNEIRKNEYNALLAEKKNAQTQRMGNKGLVRGPSNNPNSDPPPILRAEAKQQELFKDFLNSKYGNAPSKSPMREAHGIAALGNHGSAQNGNINNSREVNGRKLSTPSYEELLEQKRQDENRYRKYDDPEYSRPGFDAYMYGRDNAEAERMLDELDREFDSKKSRFDSERAMGVSHGSNWPSNQPINGDYYNSPRVPPQNGTDRSSDRRPVKDKSRTQHVPRLQLQQNFATSLPIGQEERQSARRRKQDKYRQELESQMNTRRTTRPSRGNERKTAPPAQEHNYRMKSPPTLLPPQPRVDNQMYRLPVADSNFSNSGGILENGWDGIYNSGPMSNNLPPNFSYQPTSYLDANAFNSIDEAYRYYGTKDPLAGNDYSSNYTQVPQLAQNGPRMEKVTHIQEARSVNQRAAQNQSDGAYQFRSDDSSKRNRNRAASQEYQKELQRQIMEKELEKQRKKEEQERYDRKLEEEIRNYNPFGKGGGGAPLKDDQGNTIGDLRGVIGGNVPSQPSHRSQAPPPPVAPPPSTRDVRPAVDDPSAVPPLQTNATGSVTYARGGHGIFGIPKTENEKISADKYKDDLRIQIEEKRRLQEIEKDKLRHEEEIENERLRKEQEKMQREYDEEQRKAKAKEEEMRKRNEELRKIAEERKKEAELAKKKEEEKRLKELREEQERERKAKEQTNRASPPIPTMKRKISQDQRRPSSGADKQSRAGSASILNQLAVMKQQLQNERSRVENNLVQQQEDYEVHDPRLQQRQDFSQRRESDVSVFEGARNKAPASVRRLATNPSKVFNNLKNNEDTVSRRSFRAKYPDDPQSHDTLETQQNAMIESQEKRLQNLRKKNTQKVSPSKRTKPLDKRRDSTISSQSMLQSETAFIDVNNIDSFPDDFDDLPKNESRRKQSQNSLARYNSDNISLASKITDTTSVMSLNVDRISRKNEERLRRLKAISGDEESVADPDDVIDRFISQQNHRRPSSGQTLMDDTWLQSDGTSHQP